MWCKSSMRLHDKMHLARAFMCRTEMLKRRLSELASKVRGCLVHVDKTQVEFAKTSVCKDWDVVYFPSLEEEKKNCKMRAKIEKKTGYKMGQEQENRVTVYKGPERRRGWIVGQEARDAEE